MPRLRVAVIGVGHLGKHHARILAGLPDVELAGVADVDLSQAQQAARQHGTQAFAGHHSLIGQVDAAVIAVPTRFHTEVARPFLQNSIPLLIEKPMAPSLAEANELLELAERHRTFIQVGHVERFNPAFVELQRRPLQPKFIESIRASSYTGRSTDIGAVLDIMIHDIDLLLTLVNAPVRSVDALGISVLGGHEDLATARLTFTTGCVANLTASRLHPQSIRTMQLWGPEGYAGINFGQRTLTMAQPTAALRNRSVPVGHPESSLNLFDENIEIRETDCNHGDQLTTELQEFVECVQTGSQPRVSGLAGRDALAVADCILECIKLHPWNGTLDGPTGPHQLPTSLGRLFESEEREAA